VEGASGHDPDPHWSIGVYHRRFVRALADDSSGVRKLGPADLVVLLRSAIRRELKGRVEAAVDVPVDVVHRLGIERQHWHRSSIVSMPINGERVRITTAAWVPPWLDRAADFPPEELLYEDAVRRMDESVPADPLVKELIGFDRYTSDAQREATRTVLTAPAGATVLINLPTGSGKTLCGIVPALRPLPHDPTRSGVTPFVVPTVALALDLERRLRDEDDPSYRAAYRRLFGDPEARACRFCRFTSVGGTPRTERRR